MIRLFVDTDFNPLKKVILSASQAHYLCHVMRLKTGDLVVCFNGKQGDWESYIEVKKKEVFLILKKQFSSQQKMYKSILCLSLIKRDPLNYALQKATELGVTHIYLIQAERSIREKVNMDRLKSIIIEACEQCERNDIPKLFSPQPLENVLDCMDENVYPVCLAERSKTKGKSRKLIPAFFIGPEGGWTLKEEKIFRDKDTYFWHLGNTILRAETAAVAAIVLWQYKGEIKKLAI